MKNLKTFDQINEGILRNIGRRIKPIYKTPIGNIEELPEEVQNICQKLLKGYEDDEYKFMFSWPAKYGYDQKGIFEYIEILTDKKTIRYCYRDINTDTIDEDYILTPDLWHELAHKFDEMSDKKNKNQAMLNKSFDDNKDTQTWDSYQYKNVKDFNQFANEELEIKRSHFDPIDYFDVKSPKKDKFRKIIGDILKNAKEENARFDDQDAWQFYYETEFGNVELYKSYDNRYKIELRYNRGNKGNSDWRVKAYRIDKETYEELEKILNDLYSKIYKKHKKEQKYKQSIIDQEDTRTWDSYQYKNVKDFNEFVNESIWFANLLSRIVMTKEDSKEFREELKKLKNDDEFRKKIKKMKDDGISEEEILKYVKSKYPRLSVVINKKTLKNK